uniref:Uncharacterized protein n=1 Tax=Peronospora matthiolae TaxID=2874970 RepID=A0AAV1VHI1_9STRA
MSSFQCAPRSCVPLSLAGSTWRYLQASASSAATRATFGLQLSRLLSGCLLADGDWAFQQSETRATSSLSAKEPDSSQKTWKETSRTSWITATFAIQQAVDSWTDRTASNLTLLPAANLLILTRNNYPTPTTSSETVTDDTIPSRMPDTNPPVVAYTPATTEANPPLVADTPATTARLIPVPRTLTQQWRLKSRKRRTKVIPQCCGNF